MKERFDMPSPDILQNQGILKTLKEGFEHKKKIYSPDPTTFSDTIPQLVIEDDLERVEKKKESFDQESERGKYEKMIADIFEGIVVDQFSGAWLGNKAEGYYTAEPDDLLRGVDVIAEIKTENLDEENNYLGFALDVTFSEKQEIVQKKLEGIWDYDISKSKLSEVRYFENDDFKGALSLPRLVVSANRDTVRDLVRLYHSKDRQGLENHVFQYNLLSQIKVQIEAYYQYAQIRGTDRYKEVILESLQSFYEIYDVKASELMQYAENVESDSQFRLISDFCTRKIKDLTE